MSNGVSFHDHILPLIEDRCIDCHSEPYVKNGRTIHPKAGLRLDTYEAIIKGIWMVRSLKKATQKRVLCLQ